MPLVDGKKFAYTPEGMRAAAEAKRANPGVVPMVPRTKGSMMGKGYNIARNINGGKLPDIGY
jgi:hypothetical protein